jgi:hypothetical protein
MTAGLDKLGEAGTPATELMMVLVVMLQTTLVGVLPTMTVTVVPF